jgi:serine/threonine protein kinase
MQRHSFTALNSTFVVDSEYQFVKELGQGAYGCVVAAKHRRTGEGCAIKKITNINTKVGCDFAHYVTAAADDPPLEDPHKEMSARDQVGILFLRGVSILSPHTRTMDVFLFADLLRSPNVARSPRLIII